MNLMPEETLVERLSASSISVEDRTISVLDTAFCRLKAAQFLPAFEMLGVELSACREAAELRGELPEFTRAVRAHPVFELCQQDPYTSRAYAKPRGFAGDAVMLDFVYSGIAPEGTSNLGAQIFNCTTRVPLGLSVRYRRSLLRAYLDDTVIRIPRARILSVASGHCRELDGSLLINGIRQPEYIALDQDRDACALAEREYGRPWVRVIPAGIKSLLGNTSDLGQFDFIYSAGLFDYLSDAVARALLERLCAMLRPNGRLLIANFLPNCFGRGYLEGMMDWHLTYRTDRDLCALLPKSVSPGKAFEDPHGNVVYVEASRPPTQSRSSTATAQRASASSAGGDHRRTIPLSGPSK